MGGAILQSDNIFEVSVASVSLLVSCISYLLIVRKDKSWINWGTWLFLGSLATRYVLPIIYLFMTGSSGGSKYAYSFCYTAYALSSLSAALVYAYVKPFKLRSSPSYQAQNPYLGQLAWLMLLLGFLFYLPILIEFRAYLAEPRRIYELTRTGYGVYFYTSIFLATLGFATYLFSNPKTKLGAILFFGLATALAYWHGSKGEIVNYFLIWILYRVYVDRKRIRALGALSIVGGVGILVIGSFALFLKPTDIYDLGANLTGYADIIRNNMVVIDDPHLDLYFGQLMIENEVYSRVPRAVMPGKPKDYGPFALGKKYDPAQHRSDKGDPAYDVGLAYADFGPLSMICLCGSSAFMAWLVSSFAGEMRHRPTPGRFVIFVFLAGVNVIPISGVFLLPETILIAGVLSIAQRLCIVRGGLSLRHGSSTV
jgi:hypothetical protein